MELNNTITQLDIIDKCNKVGSPSNTYDTLEWGVSGATYTAPGNGYFSIIYVPTSGTYIALENETNRLRFEIRLQHNSWNAVFLPVSKGQVVNLYHDAVGTVESFNFVYNE